MKRLLAAVVALVLVGVGAWHGMLERWEAPLQIEEGGLPLMIERGDSLRSVTDRLQASGVVRYPYLLLAYGRWTSLDQTIKRGEYLIPPGTTAGQLLNILSAGDVVQYQLTLPEGITLAQAVSILHEQPALERTLSGAQDERLLALVAPHTAPEGLFLPETYRYERSDSDFSVLQRAHRALLDTLARAWADRDEGVPYETPYEALIMASIIERETGLGEERGQIAGVFTRRLKRGMLLQTDPTIIYGLGSTFDGNLRRSHLQDATNRYNTYRHRGLPPTPIALPGKAAIHAALHPEPGKTLYFVARGDGGHQFSETLAEHNKAVRKYQLKRVQGYRSAPQQ